MNVYSYCICVIEFLCICKCPCVCVCVCVFYLIAVGQWRHRTNHPGLALLYKLLQGLSHQVSSIKCVCVCVCVCVYVCVVCAKVYGEHEREYTGRIKTFDKYTT